MKERSKNSGKNLEVSISSLQLTLAACWVKSQTIGVGCWGEDSDRRG
jgi:hypothetical protein